ncbi:dihydropteroate synthase [Peptoniphilus catoniae]|uniref:dihydropteroate synthase n=1 Tax=Peptoniphilus catoniae TaxID=1660341 RepID=UPI0010FE0570|nr:dihydropteroate synthase [Peptoniphilus catoniae]
MENLKFSYRDKTLTGPVKTMICGIINVTPDSFSDGGKYFGRDKALKRAEELIKDGADMLDIGGESTRPGSTYVNIDEEIDRVAPVVRELRNITDLPLSVDTWKAAVAKAAIEEGADIINDITGFLGDKNMAETIGLSSTAAIVMFNPVIARPNHPSSKIFPSFGAQGVFSQDELKDFRNMEIVKLMKEYFKKSLDLAKKYNIPKERIMLDPGIGFGLTKKENLILINEIDVIREMGFFTFLGVSRKRFVQNIIETSGFETNPESTEGFENRDEASSVLTSIATLKGVEAVRVHTLKHHKLARDVASAVRFAKDMEDINFGSYKNK